MRFLAFTLLLLLFSSCKQHNSQSPIQSKSDSTDISDISTKEFTEFKVLDSKYMDVEQLWEPFNAELASFSETDYNNLKPLVLEQDIPSLQKYIQEGKLSYELLTKFFLYRIRKYDRANPNSLNSVIALNPKVIEEARKCDELIKTHGLKHPIFGMPILLKDNIDASGMPTTAGAVALKGNFTEDAFIVKELKANGALILGKTNLSEWAYFFCGDCPSGYSAIGGQTLNPYGRKVLDTGGSSSGSGVAVAANFCVAAVGSETSGSILSPSSQNSNVGLKPTIGLLGRSGIVPISSTLDTPGPMTKNVIDNAILFHAMLGKDMDDFKATDGILKETFDLDNFEPIDLQGKKFGCFASLKEDPLYSKALHDLEHLGAEIVEIEAQEIQLPDFIRLLNLDMKKDLSAYLKHYADNNVKVTSVEDVIVFNREDSINRMPYGQKLFEGIVADNGTEKDLENIKSTLKTNGKLFLDTPMQKYQLDAVLSINNFHAGFAAVAEYPAITVPMGYTADKGEPKGLTFISKPFSEIQLLQWAMAYEQATKQREMPKGYN